MPTVTRTVTTPAQLDVVRDYLRDFEHATEWDAGTVSCEAVDPLTPTGVGTQVSYTATFTFRGAAKLATPLLLPALNGLADDAERSLGDALQKLPVDRP